MGQTKIFDSIINGLNEAIQDAKSDKPILKRQKISVTPIKVYTAADVKRIRNSTGMSQKPFSAKLIISTLLIL